MSNKNKISWNNGAAKYSKYSHSDKLMNRIIKNPESAFHRTTWDIIKTNIPDLCGKKICVPSSGDNHAVFAFAMLGAEVMSCDIAENQLINAERIAKQYEWGKSIRFICADTMKLDEIENSTYDFVYTSNGVHVWINDLPRMYQNIYRILKSGGIYLMHEIHPFGRPFNDSATIVKPYDTVGPFDNVHEITYHWRVMDIMNAILDSGLMVRHIEEMYAEKDYDWPFWISCTDIVNGVTATREEVDRMHDWKNNPMSALPSWINVLATR